MLSLIPLLALAPANAIFSCTGVPEITAQSGGVDLPTHSVTYSLVRGHIEGSSRTEIHNGSSTSAKVTITIPIGGQARAKNAPTVTVETKIGDRELFPRTTRGPLQVTEETTAWSRPLTTTVTLPPRSTSVLRVDFFGRIGFGGLDKRLKVVAYKFGGDLPVRQLNATFKFDADDVFGLPKLESDLGKWSVGEAGAFIRVNNYAGNGETALATFYLSTYGR